MNKHYLLGCIVLLSASIAPPAIAELFRWTDADGKVHYSDRRPNQNSNAKAIDDELTPINIDDSQSASNNLGRVFPKEDKRHQAAEKAAHQKQQKAVDKACADAREYLRKVSGRVIFLDDDGNPMKISEAGRKKRKAEIEKYIAKHCN